MSEWINVKDRLPTISKRYLVIHASDENAWDDDKLGFSSFYADTKKFNHNNVEWWFDIPLLPLENIDDQTYLIEMSGTFSVFHEVTAKNKNAASNNALDDLFFMQNPMGIDFNIEVTQNHGIKWE